jgi:hypothetical protein
VTADPLGNLHVALAGADDVAAIEEVVNRARAVLKRAHAVGDDALFDLTCDFICRAEAKGGRLLLSGARADFGPFKRGRWRALGQAGGAEFDDLVAQARSTARLRYGAQTAETCVMTTSGWLRDRLGNRFRFHVGVEPGREAATIAALIEEEHACI